ncbi:MAG: Hsp33 family molecular chaperone HslO [Pseudomonadota bacterium]
MAKPHQNALVNFLFDALPVRGVAVQLSAQWRELTALHDYAPVVREALGQAVGASAMIASTMKFEGMLTLQLSGQGSLGMLIVQCTDQLQVRGMAGELDSDLPAEDFADLIGAGRLTLTVDTRDARDRYQGIVAIESPTLAGSLAGYYRESAQLGAHFVLHADGDHVTGLMLQRMPDGGEIDEDDWRRICLMADTLTHAETAEGVDNGLLHRLFSEDDLIAYEARPVVFHCRCSQQRAERALEMLGESDARQLLEERGGEIEIVCEFCNRKRTLDAVDVARLFNPAAVDGDSAVH